MRTNDLAKQLHDRRTVFKALFPPAALVVLMTAFYSPSRRFQFIYDDHPLIVEAPMPQGTSDFASVFVNRHWQGLPYYRPLARLTMVAQKFLHGDNPAPFHLFNAVLMGLTGALVYVLFSSPAFHVSRGTAFLGAALVAVHPAASSTVYPICSGRETLMPAAFALAAMICWLRSKRIAAFGLFAAALLCKEQAVIVPALFVIADLTGLTNEAATRSGAVGQRFRKWVRRYWPAVAILTAYVLIRWWVFRTSATRGVRLAVIDDPDGPVLSVLYAVQTALTPFVDLVYEPPTDVWLAKWKLAAVAAVLAGASLGCYIYWPEVRRRVLFWSAWFLLSLLPTANVFVQEARFAERYVFLALVGVVGVGVTLIGALWHRIALRQVALVGGFTALAASALVSFGRGKFYRDDVSFHTQWVQTNPNSDQAHRSLGWAWLQRGNLQDAATHLRESIRLSPGHAEAWNNLGIVEQRRNNVPQAEALYREALKLKPDYAEAHYNLAVVLARKDPVESEAHFRRAIELRPIYSEAHNGLAIVLASQNRTQDAERHFRIAIAQDPDNAEAHHNLARLLESQGKRREAAAHYRRVLEIQPSYPGVRERLQQLGS